MTKTYFPFPWPTMYPSRMTLVAFDYDRNGLRMSKNCCSSFLAGYRFCLPGVGARICLHRLLARGSNFEWDTDDSGNTDDVREQGTLANVSFDGNSVTILLACAVGFLTGVCVVLFNYGVREIRNIFWGGIHNEGASWLREEPIGSIWPRVILVPSLGGVIVSLLNALRKSVESLDEDHPLKPTITLPGIKVIAACFTLGSGNSLGPEGPSVEIGASIAKLISSLNVFALGYADSSNFWKQRKSSFGAVGVAAGFSSGFNAALAGCFFAVESVLWPSPFDPSLSLSNTTSMVIISSVIASVISEVGLGSEPAFKVPVYDFRSFGELPLYLLLGILCGFLSLVLLRSTSIMICFLNDIHKTFGVPRVLFPVMGGFATGMLAIPYPEVLYWGFENVDILLESQNFKEGLSVELLIQLVGTKIIATSFCRASGLVGGFYAPSLFVGAAAGMAYGKLISFVVNQLDSSGHFPILQVASPQAYGLVGMASTLAGVCQVPLTSVLLLFELTQDYRIVLPLLGAVGLSSWITSTHIRREAINFTSGQPSQVQPIDYPEMEKISSEEIANLCEVESSLCISDWLPDHLQRMSEICAEEAMNTRYVEVLMNTSVTETLDRILTEKTSFALIVDNENILIGMLTLEEIELFCRARIDTNELKELSISDIFSSSRGINCHVSATVKPEADVLSILTIMKEKGVNQVPVVSDHKGKLVGVVDEECIAITYRSSYCFVIRLASFLFFSKNFLTVVD